MNSLGSQMLFVPSGEFVMGSDAPDAGPTEKPLTKVTLSRFYISRHPVTNAEYEQFVQAGGDRVRPQDPGARGAPQGRPRKVIRSHQLPGYSGLASSINMIGRFARIG